MNSRLFICRKNYRSNKLFSCLIFFIVDIIFIFTLQYAEADELSLWLLCNWSSGVSSFNQFIHELSVDSDASSSIDYSSEEEFSDDNICPPSPLSQSSHASRAGSFSRYDGKRMGWIRLTLSCILVPAKILLAIVSYLFYSCYSSSARSALSTESENPSHVSSVKKLHNLKDHIIHRTTDRRRGVVEVWSEHHGWFLMRLLFQLEMLSLCSSV